MGTEFPAEPPRRGRLRPREVAIVLLGLYLLAAATYIWDANRDAGYALPTVDGRKLREAWTGAVYRANERQRDLLQAEWEEAKTPEARVAIRQELDALPRQLEQDLADSIAGSRLKSALSFHGPLMVLGAMICGFLCLIGAFDPANWERGRFLLATLFGLVASTVALSQAWAYGFMSALID